MAEEKKAEKQAKKTVGAPKGKRKQSKSLSKTDVEKILEMAREKPIKAQDLAKQFDISPAMANKVLSYINKTQWKPKNNDDLLPKGYFAPSNYSEVIDSVFFEKGYVKSE